MSKLCLDIRVCDHMYDARSTRLSDKSERSLIHFDLLNLRVNLDRRRPSETINHSNRLNRIALSEPVFRLFNLDRQST